MLIPNPRARRLCAILITSVLSIVDTSLAQSSPNCPFLGPVSTPAREPGKSSAVSRAFDELKAALSIDVVNGTLALANTTVYVQAFTADATLFQYGYVHPGSDVTLTSGRLDENTVFRIGSVSKLLTVYTLLAETGLQQMNEPVTKWIPELASQTSSGNSNRVEDVSWNDVTIGALASQLSGVNRDLSLADKSILLERFNETTIRDLGLPIIPTKEVPTCGTDPVLPPCSRKEFFDGIQTLHPITAAFQTPIYSNIGYQILAYVLEEITNKTFADAFRSSLLHPLNLTRTSLEAPATEDNVIIPIDPSTSWWNLATGGTSSFGGMYSTAADLTTLGQSILSSSLLAPAVTRAWLKPRTHTADLRVSVGMPWEIRRMLLPFSANSTNTRVVDIYSKNGDFGLYSALIALSPDHEAGIVLLGAGASTARSAALNALADLVFVARLLPALEAAAREEAVRNYAGTFFHAETNASLVLGVDEGLPGLSVRSWMSGAGVDLLQTYPTVMFGIPSTTPVGLRLYPMGLSGQGRVRFRGVFERIRSAPAASEGTAAGAEAVFSGGCLSWGGADAPQYGNVGFDDFDFEVDDVGQAVGVRPRVMRQTLSRVRRGQ